MNYIVAGICLLVIGITNNDGFIIAIGGVLLGRGFERLKVLMLWHDAKRQQQQRRNTK